MSKVIFLVGARGCGKTTIGRKVAEYLAWSFADTDEVVQAREGCTIAHMVEHLGWEAFRQKESAALEACVEKNEGFPLVLATGGGMVLAEKNRIFMRQQGLVFFLHVPESILVSRLTAHPHASQRPSLTGQDVAKEVHTVLQKRLPLYEGVAHHKVDAALSIAQVTEKIYTCARKHF